MARPPRNIEVERLVSFPLLVYSYIVMGLAESVICMGAYLWVFTENNVDHSDIFLIDPDDEIWTTDEDENNPITNDAGEILFSGEDQARIVREVCPSLPSTLAVHPLSMLVASDSFSSIGRHFHDGIQRLRVADTDRVCRRMLHGTSL